MKAGLCCALITLMSLFAGAQSAAPAVSFKFTSFDYPGALATQPLGINNADFIVGYYVDNAFVSHGFARSPNGRFVQIDYPQSTETIVFGINDSNVAVGFYTDSPAAYQGFEFRYPNEFTAVDYPNGAATTPYGINDAGQIVGAWGTQPQQGGFSLLNGTYTDLSYPGAELTYARGVNSTGLIVGSWVSTCNPDCQYHGFVLTGVGGIYSDVDYLGASMTYINGVNDLNQVVGYYDSLTGMHCWVGIPAKNRYVTADYPGSNGCFAGGITNKGHLAGSYTDADNVTHGFLAVPQ